MTNGETLSNRVLGMLIRGEASDEVDERGRANRGETLVVLFNGGGHSRLFELPAMPEPGRWVEVANTARAPGGPVTTSGVNLTGHSLILLRHEVAR
jgi:hypothetical protein